MMPPLPPPPPPAAVLPSLPQSVPLIPAPPAVKPGIKTTQFALTSLLIALLQAACGWVLLDGSLTGQAKEIIVPVAAIVSAYLAANYNTGRTKLYTAALTPPPPAYPPPPAFPPA